MLVTLLLNGIKSFCCCCWKKGADVIDDALDNREKSGGATVIIKDPEGNVQVLQSHHPIRIKAQGNVQIIQNPRIKEFHMARNPNQVTGLPKIEEIDEEPDLIIADKFHTPPMLLTGSDSNSSDPHEMA